MLTAESASEAHNPVSFEKHAGRDVSDAYRKRFNDAYVEMIVCTLLVLVLHNFLLESPDDSAFKINKATRTVFALIMKNIDRRFEEKLTNREPDKIVLLKNGISVPAKNITSYDLKLSDCTRVA